jgi:hypothetical protein
LLGCLGHGVERAAVLEPLNLTLVEGVCELDVESLATVGGVDDKSHGLANGELGALEVDLVCGADLVVVGGVGEGKRSIPCFFKLVSCWDVLAAFFAAFSQNSGVKTYDTSERSDNDGKTSQVTGLESGVLTG